MGIKDCRSVPALAAVVGAGCSVLVVASIVAVSAGETVTVFVSVAVRESEELHPAAMRPIAIAAVAKA